MQHTYKLKYLADWDDSCPKRHLSDTPINTGDVIEVDNGFYHYVSEIRQLKTGLQLVLSESAQSESSAQLLAEQHGHVQGIKARV